MSYEDSKWYNDQRNPRFMGTGDGINNDIPDGEGEDGSGEEQYYNKARDNQLKKLPCDKCKGKIGDMDVEGHYSGVCAHCRGDD